MVESQQKHHRKNTFEEEYRSLLLESGIRIDEKISHKPHIQLLQS